LGATWFGFYLAKQLSVPIEEMGKATKRVSRGDYQRVAATASSTEINQLIENFNSMTGTIEQSQRELTLKPV
jgi:two-component system nitrogen regulation sensor histidine kinase NtrY